MEEFNASSEEELNRKIYNATENIMMVKNKSSQTMKMLDSVNAAVLGAGADVLSAMGQEEIAQVVREQSCNVTKSSCSHNGNYCAQNRMHHHRVHAQ